MINISDRGIPLCAIASATWGSELWYPWAVSISLCKDWTRIQTSDQHCLWQTSWLKSAPCTRFLKNPSLHSRRFQKRNPSPPPGVFLRSQLQSLPGIAKETAAMQARKGYRNTLHAKKVVSKNLGVSRFCSQTSRFCLWLNWWVSQVS